jgi:magnesium chelatase family protein
MLARRLPSILPPLTRAESIEVTRIHSIVGIHHDDGLIAQRPFRAPHHTVSASGLVGGGTVPAPGEASFAHRGVLFLDELSEFSKRSLESLRQPLEDGCVAIVRGQRTLIFPTQFMLVAATNPCPCGMNGSGGEGCACSASDLMRHRKRLSGPLLDRIDLLVDVERPSAKALGQHSAHTSQMVRERVMAARERQARRLAAHSVTCNAQMGARLLHRHVNLTDQGQLTLQRAYDLGSLTVRGHDRILRVARTIADLAEVERVDSEHVMRALALRQDRADNGRQH